MKFSHYAPFWIDNLGGKDFSLGLHICWQGRIDLHFYKWIISIGKVPIYKHREKFHASSNSFDRKYHQQELDRQAPQFRIASFP